MKTLARVILLGIVGKDPEVKPTKSGSYIATFPIATMTKKKDPNGNSFDATLWHNIVAFGKVAENMQKSVTKGAKIYIDGTIDYQEWIDSNSEKRLTTKIIVNDFSVISKSEYQQSKEQLSNVGNKVKKDDFFDDDMPF